MTARPRRKRASRAGCVVALTTLPDLAEAKRLARILVGERLCACVNVVPGLRSVYRWEGRVREDREVLLILKTTPTRFAALKKRLLALHPYDVPELLAWPTTRVAEAYGRWVFEATS